jgi:hypothetical protein
LERVLLRAIMDISAPAFSLAARPRTDHLGHQGTQAPGKTGPPSRLIVSQTSAGKTGTNLVTALSLIGA